jgi:hypothetical protein
MVIYFKVQVSGSVLVTLVSALQTRHLLTYIYIEDRKTRESTVYMYDYTVTRFDTLLSSIVHSGLIMRPISEGANISFHFA